MTAENPTLSTPPSQEANSIRKSKEQLLSAWEKLPTEHKATMALVLVTDIMAGAYRPWLQSTIATQWPLQTGQLETAYPHLDITKDDLRQVHIEEEEIEQITPVHLRRIAQTMREHYIYDVFWPELQHVSGLLLEELGDNSQKP